MFLRSSSMAILRLSVVSSFQAEKTGLGLNIVFVTVVVCRVL